MSQLTVNCANNIKNWFHSPPSGKPDPANVSPGASIPSPKANHTVWNWDFWKSELATPLRDQHFTKFRTWYGGGILFEGTTKLRVPVFELTRAPRSEFLTFQETTRLQTFNSFSNSLNLFQSLNRSWSDTDLNRLWNLFRNFRNFFCYARMIWCHTEEWIRHPSRLSGRSII